jgi:hypothetical protein
MDNTPYKLGRLKRSNYLKIPHADTIRKSVALSALPQSIDYTVGMPQDLGMMLNDRLGDCTCAAFYHAIQVWSFNTQHKVLTEPDFDVEMLYEKACGYDPKTGGQGNGGIEENVLNYLLTEGAPMQSNPPHKITAFYQINVKNNQHVKETIHDCGVLYLGFVVPDYVMPQNSEPPEVWDIKPDWNGQIEGGHAVIIAGYSPQGLRVISWGKYYTMTWTFFDVFVDEGYAIVDSEWVTAKNTTPLGMSITELESVMASMR